MQYMPQHFSRHKLNTTYLNWKTNELYWRIEWIFPQAENTKWITERALESRRLSSLVEAVINPIHSLEDKTNIEEINVRMNLNERLQFYRASGISGLKVLLKAEKIENSKSKFYELDTTLTLKENLEDKIIIEFPTIYVILRDHSDMYEIIDTDDETEDLDSESKSARKRRKPDRSSNEKDSSSSVNYFFNTDFSESDDEKKTTEQRPHKHDLGFSIPDYNELIHMEQ